MTKPLGNPRFGKNQPKNYCGKNGRSGLSRTPLRHGLIAGSLPKDARYIEHRLNNFRRCLEDAVLSAKGSVSITDAACIQTAMRWERHAALAQRWLTKEYEKMKPEERLKFSTEIAKASAHRDKAILAIGLNRDQFQDAWTILDATPSNGDLEDK